MEKQAPSQKKGLSCLQVGLIIFLVMILTAAGTFFAIKTWIFQDKFNPVVLSQQEEKQLEQKLNRFAMLETVNETKGRERQTESSTGKKDNKPLEEEQYLSDGKLKPEPYSEENASREIAFSEREINAILAKNTDLADKVAIDLSNNLISIKALIPVDPDFPMLGGKTLKVKGGVEMAYHDGQPSIILKGVSVMGVPIPSAWLGGLKNVDLIEEFGEEDGFWKGFADGVESIRVEDEQLYVKLKE